MMMTSRVCQWTLTPITSTSMSWIHHSKTLWWWTSPRLLSSIMSINVGLCFCSVSSTPRSVITPSHWEYSASLTPRSVSAQSHCSRLKTSQTKLNLYLKIHFWTNLDIYIGPAPHSAIRNSIIIIIIITIIIFSPSVLNIIIVDLVVQTWYSHYIIFAQNVTRPSTQNYCSD